MLAPRVVNAMDDELRAQITTLVDVFADKGAFDGVADIANLYPTQVFLTLFGMPPDDRDHCIAWSTFIIEQNEVSQKEPSDEAAGAAGQLSGYINGFIEQKRANPGDDMLSKILQLEGDETWPDEEVFGLCFFFTLAGPHTVTAASGFALRHLAMDLDLQRRLRADESLIGPFIDEVIRLEPPAPFGARVTHQDVTISGVTIPEGTMINVVNGAANRDRLASRSPTR